jgi:hypothetical protein
VIERGQNRITELIPAAREEFFKTVQPLYEKYGKKQKSLLKEICAAQ